MIGRILCRLGWHSWKPHFARVSPSVWVYSAMPSPSAYDWFIVNGYSQVECRCRRCPKRVSVDHINPNEGLGFCPVFSGYNYPAAKRYCREFEEKPVDE